MLNWHIRRIVEPILAAVVMCLALAALGIPVAWLIGSLLAGVGYALGTGGT